MFKGLFLRVLSFFWKEMRSFRWHFLALFVIRVFTALVPMVQARYLGKIIDILGTSSPTAALMTTLFGLLRVLAGWMLADMASWRVVEYLMIDTETKTMQRLYQVCFAYLHGHSQRFFSNSFTGALVKRVAKLVRGFETILDIFIFELVLTGTTAIATLSVIRRYESTLGLFMLVRLILFLIVQWYLNKWILPLELVSQKEDSRITAELADTISNTTTITQFAQKYFEEKRFGLVTESWRTAMYQSWMRKNWVYAISDGLMIIMQLVALYFFIRAWQTGVLSPGIVVTLQLYVFRLGEKLFFIGRTYKRFFDAIAEAHEMIEILHTPHEIQDIPQAPALAFGQGAIVFDRVFFWYTPERPILENFSLTIRPGEKVAFVGATGSGKTTLSKLIMRQYDSVRGTISIDGQNIQHVAQQSLREHIGLVPQDSLLFHRSLRENIAYAKPDATDAEIIRAAELAHCHEFIATLSEGYNTMVGERGVKLSGGERQRVAIARAILADRPILILDEATSALDSYTEKLIQQAIRSLLQGKTAIVIAHRLSTIKEMDRIVVLDHGCIIEQGSHDELLQSGDGVYKKLWKIQGE